MRPDSRVAVLWDIDGTLLTTARAGVVALEDAVWEVLHRREDLSGLFTSGLTDRMVARAILVSLELAPDPVTEEAILAAYCRELPYRLTQRRGHVMKCVVEILDRLRDHAMVTTTLLTGNLRAGAAAKLRSYGLDHYFDMELGGFGEDGYDRIEIAGSLLERLKAVHDMLNDAIYVVGDTPSDVGCGKAVGVRTIAVASGLHSVDELASFEPWWVLERLPAADEFLRRIGLC